jgi:hypothetical protein
MTLTVTVTVGIPVNLEFSGKTSLEAIKTAALENFAAHPSLSNVADLEVYVDTIDITGIYP